MHCIRRPRSTAAIDVTTTSPAGARRRARVHAVPDSDWQETAFADLHDTFEASIFEILKRPG